MMHRKKSASNLGPVEITCETNVSAGAAIRAESAAIRALSKTHRARSREYRELAQTVRATTEAKRRAMAARFDLAKFKESHMSGEPLDLIFPRDPHSG